MKLSTSTPFPFPQVRRLGAAGRRFAVLALLASAGLLVAPPTASAAGDAVFRCRAKLPGVACELAGIAVRSSNPESMDVLVSGCNDPVSGGVEYCGMAEPTPGLPRGLLFLREEGERFELSGSSGVLGGFGGAAWVRGDLFQSVYTRHGIARFKVGEGAEVEEIDFLEVPGRGRVGGLASDGVRLYAHETALDRILVIEPETGEVQDELPVPAEQAINGLAWLDGRLYAVINDDEMSGDSTGDGPATEAIVALDPNDGTVVAEWRLPEGVYPHSMDALGPNSLAVIAQTDPGPLAEVYVWELIPGDGSGVTVEPCR